MRNEIIAIVAISFVTVGALWGIGNILNPPKESEVSNVEGILLITQRSTFNDTNPDIRVSVNSPEKLVVRNDDVVTHDLKIDSNGGKMLVVNTAPLQPGRDFITAVLAYEPGTFEYYCSYHPEMRGRIIAQ
jgi:heme/copper-type cytochrome/quinol oxidase subunit 2